MELYAMSAIGAVLGGVSFFVARKGDEGSAAVLAFASFLILMFAVH
ncbi:MAG: hypothetical protein O3A46_12665 [Candidatus Poribacteria bacterium]|nr:hypothetical protein [Candidatus Poribacteria bacterium]